MSNTLIPSIAETGAAPRNRAWQHNDHVGRVDKYIPIAIKILSEQNLYANLAL